MSVIKNIINGSDVTVLFEALATASFLVVIATGIDTAIALVFNL